MAWTQENFRQSVEIGKANADWGKQKLNSGGVCFSLLVYWVRFHMQNPGSSPASRMKALRDKEALLQAGARQSMYSDIFKDNANHAGFEQQQAFSGILKFNGLQVSGEKSGHLDPPVYNCGSLVTDVNQPKKHMYLSIKASAGGHAIGAYKQSGGTFDAGKSGFRLSRDLYVFDPNFGEFTIEPSSIGGFFKALFKTYNSGTKPIRFDRYYLYTLSKTTTSAQDLSKALFGIGEAQGAI